MKFVIGVLVAAIALSPIAANAQAPEAAAAQEQIERTIGNLVIANANLSAQLQQARTVIAELQKKLAASVPKAEEPKGK